MFCRQCGAQIETTSKFCGSCGAPAGDSAVQQAQSPPHTPPPAPNQGGYYAPPQYPMGLYPPQQQQQQQHTSGMMRGNIVLRGDTSAAKAFVRYIPLCVFLVIAGIIFFVLGFTSIDDSYANASFNYAMPHIYMPLIVAFLGVIFVILGAATPFLAVMEAKKMHIDVYEDRVCGAYKQVAGGGNRGGYIPFELTFDKIESVSGKGTKIFLQISGRTLESKAFNANEIINEISRRIVR